MNVNVHWNKSVPHFFLPLPPPPLPPSPPPLQIKLGGPIAVNCSGINFNYFILWVVQLDSLPNTKHLPTDRRPTTSAIATKLLIAFVLKAIILLYSIFVQHNYNVIIFYFRMMMRFRWTWKSRRCNLMPWKNLSVTSAVLT